MVESTYEIRIAALHLLDRERPPGYLHRRWRRRGPRSLDALARRSRPSAASVVPPVVRANRVFSPHDGGPCESGSVPPSIINSFTILHHNIRGFLIHKRELEILLSIYKYPDFVALVETFLDPSVSNPQLPGYVEIGRRDRGSRRQKGGVIIFVREALANYVVHLCNSKNAERIWVIIHSDQGPILLGFSYRRPSYGEIKSIRSLKIELQEYGTNKIGIFYVEI